MRLAALSVDLDEIHHYHHIHGLLLDGREAHLVYDVALARIGDFAARLDVPVTLFAVGEDLERPASADALRALVRRGHVVESHSMRHRYDLVRQPPATIGQEIDHASEIITHVTGRSPRGFRAPGYTIDDAVFDALEARGVRFDSSVFPCPPYYAAKAVALGWIAARGRTSASILDTPRVLSAPRRPYRPGRPWWREGERRIVELPVSVTRGPRLPFFGTLLAFAGATGARALAELTAGEPLVNLEMHGIDFLDASDGLATLARHQRELRVPLERRLGAYEAAIATLLRRGHELVTLDEAATRFARA